MPDKGRQHLFFYLNHSREKQALEIPNERATCGAKYMPMSHRIQSMGGPWFLRKLEIRPSSPSYSSCKRQIQSPGMSVVAWACSGRTLTGGVNGTRFKSLRGGRDQEVRKQEASPCCVGGGIEGNSWLLLAMALGELQEGDHVPEDQAWNHNHMKLQPSMLSAILRELLAPK